MFNRKLFSAFLAVVLLATSSVSTQAQGFVPRSRSLGLNDANAGELQAHGVWDFRDGYCFCAVLDDEETLRPGREIGIETYDEAGDWTGVAYHPVDAWENLYLYPPRVGHRPACWYRVIEFLPAVRGAAVHPVYITRASPFRQIPPLWTTNLDGSISREAVEGYRVRFLERQKEPHLRGR